MLINILILGIEIDSQICKEIPRKGRTKAVQFIRENLSWIISINTYKLICEKPGSPDPSRPVGKHAGKKMPVATLRAQKLSKHTCLHRKTLTISQRFADTAPRTQ